MSEKKLWMSSSKLKTYNMCPFKFERLYVSKKKSEYIETVKTRLNKTLVKTIVDFHKQSQKPYNMLFNRERFLKARLAQLAPPDDVEVGYNQLPAEVLKRYLDGCKSGEIITGRIKDTDNTYFLETDGMYLMTRIDLLLEDSSSGIVAKKFVTCPSQLFPVGRVVCQSRLSTKGRGRPA